MQEGTLGEGNTGGGAMREGILGEGQWGGDPGGGEHHTEGGDLEPPFLPLAAP